MGIVTQRATPELVLYSKELYPLTQLIHTNQDAHLCQYCLPMFDPYHSKSFGSKYVSIECYYCTCLNHFLRLLVPYIIHPLHEIVAPSGFYYIFPLTLNIWPLVLDFSNHKKSNVHIHPLHSPHNFYFFQHTYKSVPLNSKQI